MSSSPVVSVQSVPEPITLLANTISVASKVRDQSHRVSGRPAPSSPRMRSA